ncbi:MAG: hypothetical protein Q9159_006913 [Coniocarpon cinnabarinum]
MDGGQCNLIYYDPRASSDLILNESSFENLVHNDGNALASETKLISDEEVKQNIRAVLPSFHEVHLVKNTLTCVTKIRELEARDVTLPTVLLIYVQDSEITDCGEPNELENSPSPDTERSGQNVDDPGGISFLRQVKSRSTMKHMTCVLLLARRNCADKEKKHRGQHIEYFAYGAADVVQDPISSERASSLPAHAFRSLQERPSSDPSQILKPLRKSSLTVDDNKPYAYLRESMVSGLMDRICNPGYTEKPIDPLFVYSRSL